MGLCWGWPARVSVHTYNCPTPIDLVGLYMVRGLYGDGDVFRVYGEKNMKGIFMK